MAVAVTMANAPGLSEFILLPWHYENNSLNQGALPIVTTMAIRPILYGIIYFLAWKDHFPAPLERLLWRASSFGITCPGLVRISVLCSV